MNIEYIVIKLRYYNTKLIVILNYKIIFYFHVCIKISNAYKKKKVSEQQFIMY